MGKADRLGAGSPLSERAAGHQQVRTARDVVRELSAAVILVVLVLGSAYFLPAGVAGAVLLVSLLLFAARRVILTWPTALTVLVLIVMLVPIRRYSLAGDVGMTIEPYRAYLLLLLGSLLLSLLIEQKPQWRPIVFGWPIAAFLLTLWISIVFNGESLVASELALRSALALLEMIVFLSVYFIVRIILASETIVMRMLTLMVWCAAFVAVFAVVERATTWNLFLSLHTFLPFHPLRDAVETLRAGAGRAYGSAQHPIALGVALTMLVPIALYLGKFGTWPRNPVNRMAGYLIASSLMLAGVVAAVSRTSVVVLGAMFVVTLVLIPRLGLLIAMVGVPLFLLGALLVPDVYNETVWAFFSPDELVASQYTSPGWRGAGRLADLAPAFEQIRQDPYFGSGIGSRITVGEEANAFILDNQFLATLMEAGAVGIAGLIALFFVPAVMLIVFAFRAPVARRHAAMAMAIAISSIGYLAAMFFYDAFAFMQTFLIEMLLLAAGAWAISEAPRIADRREARPVFDRVPAEAGPAADRDGAEL